MSRSPLGDSYSSLRLDRRQLAGAAGLAVGALGAQPLAGTAQDATPAATPVASPVVPAVTPYNGEEVTLSYGFWDTAQEPAIDEQIAAFNARFPNITIEKQIVPWANYWTQLQTAVSGGAPFDVFWMNSSNFPPYASSSALLPINQILGGDGVAVDRLPAVLVAPYAFGGVQYGVPRDFDAIAIYYNKTLFDDAGVAYPTAEWTWDDFRRRAVDQEGRRDLGRRTADQLPGDLDQLRLPEQR